MRDILEKYFVPGFSLANKSWDLITITLFFSFLNIVIGYIPRSPLGILFQFVSIIFIFFSYGYSLGLPIFLVMRQQHKKISLSDVVVTTIKNVRKSFVAMILIGAIAGIPVMIYSLFFVFNTNPSFSVSEDAISSSIFNPVSFLFIAINSFMVFAAIFYSLENLDLFAAIKKSFRYCLGHLPFVVIVLCMNAVLHGLNFVMPVTSWGKQVQMIQLVMGTYVGMIVTTSALLYYQDKKNK